MIEGIILFCWVLTSDGPVHESCKSYRYQMHQSENMDDCRYFISRKIKEVKGTNARVQMALCVMHRT
jgi:hypothetical protein